MTVQEREERRFVIKWLGVKAFVKEYYYDP